MKKKIELMPIFTEKMARLQEEGNKYAFRVEKKANKIEIKKAVEETFEVKVKSVRTMVMPGKMRQQLTRAGRFYGRRPSWKKAIVTLESGHEIDIFANA
ncbi:MAG TPA: 50S ribosomal protein L23 [Calditrichaeota bacterium]|nr:50S ribosomal protein L23 [Calditrichota bacterium]